MAPSNRPARGNRPARHPRPGPRGGRAGEYVYEPGAGWVEEAAPAAPGPPNAPAAGAQTAGPGATTKPVVVGRETKGRKGAGVTVVNGLAMSDEALASLARELKQLCATGGTVRGATIELQGEHRDRVVAELVARGWAARRSRA